MQDAHTLYMDLSNLVSIQIKIKLFTSRYLYIHSFPMPMGYIQGGSTNLLKKCGVENSWMPYAWYKMCICPKMKCQASCFHPRSH
jgi:hypothetical protein